MIAAILFDDLACRRDSMPDVTGVLEAVAAVEWALLSAGHTPIRIPAGDEMEAWSRDLRARRPDVVFNLCESLDGQGEGEVRAARIVEDLGIPMTGSPAWTLALARHKDRVNALLHDVGLPVPSWAVWNGSAPARWVARWTDYPAIVKPAAEDASVGITQGSVVREPRGLGRQLEAMAGLAPLMVQAFVGSRELNAAMVGDVVLPLSEIVFDGLPAGHHRIVDYAAKWAPGSPEDLGTRPVCPAAVSVELADRIGTMALRAWSAVGGRGYGRVDFRLGPSDVLYVLEVNPNPDLAPSAGLARSARALGWDYGTLVERILAEIRIPAEVPA